MSRLLALAIVVVAVVAASCGGATEVKTQPDTTPTPVSSQAGPVNSEADVGDPITLSLEDGSQVEVTPLEVKLFPTKRFIIKNQTNVYGVKLQLRNTGTSAFRDPGVGSNSHFIGADGQEFAYIGDNPADALYSVTIEPGGLRTGWVYVVAPKGAELAGFQYQPDFDSNVGVWAFGH